MNENKFTLPLLTAAPMCPCCSLSHALWKCEKFKRQNETQRRTLVNEKSLCYNCLGSHVARNCRSTSKYRVCQKRHHTLLHHDTNSADIKRQTAQGESAERETGAGDETHVMSVALDSETVKTQDNDSELEAIAANALESKREGVRLKVFAVKVWGSHGKHVDTYDFLDKGSDSSLCSEELRKKLHIRGQSVQYSLSTLKGTYNYDGQRISLSVKGLNESAVAKLSGCLSVLSLLRLPGLEIDNKKSRE